MSNLLYDTVPELGDRSQGTGSIRDSRTLSFAGDILEGDSLTSLATSRTFVGVVGSSFNAGGGVANFGDNSRCGLVAKSARVQGLLTPDIQTSNFGGA
jgi:hypothetical protein